MTQGTRSISPAALAVGRIITVCPDPMATEARQPGEWTMNRHPIEYGEFVRLDVTDPRGKASVWLVHTDHAVTVQLTRGEEQAAAARVIADLAGAGLPDIYEWEIRDGRVRAWLAAQSWEAAQSRADLAAWAEHLGCEVAEEEQDGRTLLTAAGEVDGVPVEVRTSIYDADKEKAEVAS
ncbi:hypothetical protein SAMN04489712_105249 [Thermomonospora echinospora]|uniref:Uncharacterized protein n=1 Tax=Thermomonospora echinospora TaxID=1992 RepID=A0A1H6A6M1_9ACTN|nr:hypothetical protein [Thermomonospora echinospora]SEG44383.1 hypothetical protein SAMN04489712_105249 [Thermomonospora echinospora]